MWSINGPSVTSGPNGPELNKNVLENENGDSWSRDFFKVLLNFGLNQV